MEKTIKRSITTYSFNISELKDGVINVIEKVNNVLELPTALEVSEKGKFLDKQLFIADLLVEKNEYSMKLSDFVACSNIASEQNKTKN